jgi:hypothetical protein
MGGLISRSIGLRSGDFVSISYGSLKLLMYILPGNLVDISYMDKFRINVMIRMGRAFDVARSMISGVMHRKDTTYSNEEIQSCI